MTDLLTANVIDSLGSSYPIAQIIYAAIGVIFSALVFHRSIYSLIGLFFTRKFAPAKKNHKYAIVIAARNESSVIGNLLDSIAQQDYPKELLTVFVVADNCTDNTAEIARKKGAVCYERFDNEHRTKGFALQFLFERIEEDYGRQSFEGYFVFDADNLLKSDFVSRMNDSFDAGCKLVTSYRNTKNFNESWVASTYALHWLRSIRSNHRARSVLRLATNIQGTGFLFSNEIVRDGWKYTSLTEDRALTADAVAQGYEISYNNDAEFFDEQPNSIKIALRQRLRWSKGHLMAFAETGPNLLGNIIFGKLFLKNPWNKPKKIEGKLTFKEHFMRFVESIRHRWASFDTLMQLTPFSVFNIIRWIIVPLILYSCFCYTNGMAPSTFFRSGSFLGQFMRFLFPFKVAAEPGIEGLFIAFLTTIWWRLFYRMGAYLKNMWVAVYIFIIERKRIIKIPLIKKILYTFTWPTFDIIGRYTQYVALFVKVTWKPIPHESKITINDLKKH